MSGEIEWRRVTLQPQDEIRLRAERVDIAHSPDPHAGLIPVSPAAPHGQRIDPPVSEASEPKQSPAAVATAGPLEEMPVQYAEFHGFFGGVIASVS